MRAPTIYLHNLNFTYNDQFLFKDLNLILPAGKCTAVLGPSGVGKTTLLRIIAGLEEQAGSECSYMAQTDLLLPWLTAKENALISMKLTGQNILSDRVDELFSQVGLNGKQNKYPHELSGGMRQRVALVRTFIQNKSLVLMDEPFSAVDAITRFQLQSLTADLLKDRTTLLITHDPLEALRLADEIYILSGQPAILTKVIAMHSPVPRDPASSEILYHQAELFHALVKAKELT